MDQRVACDLWDGFVPVADPLVTPPAAQGIVCSVPGSLSQKTCISSSFSWDNFALSSCFFKLDY